MQFDEKSEEYRKATEEAANKLNALVEKLKEVEKAKEKHINVFAAAGMGTQEVKHSYFLAWLLSPKKPHGLGNIVLKEFVLRLAEYKADYVGDAEYKSNNEILALKSDALNDFVNDREIVVETEKVVLNKESRMDIFIESAATKTVLVIENKVFTGTHDDQLIRYEEELSGYHGWKKIFVYLTPNGDLPTNADGGYNKLWCVFDYREVLEIAKDLMRHKDFPSGKDGKKLKIMLEDYIEMVDTEILKGNKELRALCRQILREHGEAIEILNSYTDNAKEVIKFCEDWLTANYEGLCVYRRFDLSFSFYTKAMKEYMERHGDSILREDGYHKLGCHLICPNGPIETCISLSKRSEDEWSEAQLKLQKDLMPQKKVGTQYFSFNKITLLSANEREMPFAEIRVKLEKELVYFVEKTLSEFDKALKNL